MSEKRDTAVTQWCYTVFSEDEEEWPSANIPDELCRYRIEGKEICPETKRKHIQGYVQFYKKTRFSALKKIHPTAHWLKAKGTPWENYTYCSKDGDFTEIGTSPKQPKKTSDEAYTEALSSPTVEEAIGVIKEKRPRDFCLHGEAIERNIKRSRQTQFVHQFTADEFNISLQNLSKSTLIYGQSNTGKSHYATVHFRQPLMISHIDELKMLSPDNDGIIFDDMSFKHWPPESVIHLLDQEFKRSINIRYGTVSIPAHTPKIFTHNTSNPFYADNIDDEQKEAIERRVNRVHVLNKLY